MEFPPVKVLFSVEQVPQAYLKQQSGSSASFSLDHLKIDSTPTLVTDTNGNHFLIALTNHLTGNKIKAPAEGKATNHITLQVRKLSVLAILLLFELQNYNYS